jgi:antimicrobial peptide system SdpB family protein
MNLLPPAGWASTEPERAVARSVLAVAQLVTLLATPATVLFARAPQPSPDTRCLGLRGASLWCVVGTGPTALQVGRWVAVAALAVVVAGFRPRWTCIPHWYVAFSLHASLAFPNGGEYAAQIATLLLIPSCLGDRRAWQWRAVEPVTPRWRGAAEAARLAVRCQLLIIYLWAAVAKLASVSWRHGTAMRTIVDDPLYGVAPAFRQALDARLDSGPSVAVLTWSVVAAELAIAASMVGTRRIRRYGVALAVLLHSAIVVSMGLFSFGLIMIAFVVLGSAGGSGPGRRPRGPAPSKPPQSAQKEPQREPQKEPQRELRRERGADAPPAIGERCR